MSKPIQFISTRNSTSARSGDAVFGIREGIERGLAPDGGLLVPTEFPRFEPKKLKGLDLPALATEILKPFFKSDAKLTSLLPEVCQRAFTFPAPIAPVSGRSSDFFLELFHGPTAAFKDFGARFLAEVTALALDGKKKTVLVATSGDTGGAVAAAFHNRPGFQVAILFPKGRVSPRQEHQLCAWGGNVRAFSVEGTFDDCQKMVKGALASNRAGEFLSANSISLGRILPQMVYYAATSLAHPGAGLIIPSGNLGNSLAAIWARECGLRIGPVVLALNENHVALDYLETGKFVPQTAKPTLANAMDVGVPSNLERLRHLYGDSIEKFRTASKHVSADTVSDDEIRETIRWSETEWGRAICPHTAVAVKARRRLRPETARLAKEWVLVSTAHPAKFETVVEPLVGHAIAIPSELEKILQRPAKSESLAPNLEALLAKIKTQ